MDLSHLIGACKLYLDDRNGTMQLPPRLKVYRRDTVSDIEASVYEPAICLILQGSKTTSIGDQSFELKPGDALLVTHDLPVVSRITKASAREPYLALILSLDLALVRNLSEQVLPPCEAGDDATGIRAATVRGGSLRRMVAGEADTSARSLSVGRADPQWLQPLTRYSGLMHNAQDTRILGPSTLLEVHYRLLLSPMGEMLRRLLVADSHASRIAKAIQRLRAEFRSKLQISDLAAVAGMSASSFHHHFRSVTGTTPLKFLKDIRLIAARAMLVNEGHPVSRVSYAVGYESPTHFSRDYHRKFGLPPSKHARGDATAQRISVRTTREFDDAIETAEKIGI